MSAGKGPELRKGANLNLYWQNYDRIFRKEIFNKKAVEEDEKEVDGTEELSYSELQKTLNRTYK